MKKFPFYKQLDAMDCGPSCLRMIATFYGLYYSLQILREKSQITRQGVSMLGLQKAAEYAGFHALGIKTDFANLKSKVYLPCIVHWNQKHFIVVYKITSKYVYVADPAYGLIKYLHNEFIEKWAVQQHNSPAKGFCLLLKPDNSVAYQQEKKEEKSGFSYLFRQLKPYKKQVYQVLLSLAVASIIQFLFPFLAQSIVDTGIENADIDFIYLILIAHITLYASKTVIDFIRSHMLLQISTRINVSLISEFLLKLMKLPLRFFDTRLLGDVIQRVNDHKRIESFLTVSSLNVVLGLFNLLVFSIILLYYNVVILGVFILGSAIYLIYATAFLKQRKQIDYKRFAEQGEHQGKVIEIIEGMPEIKLNQLETKKRTEWEEIQAKIFRLNVQTLKITQFQTGGGRFINELKNILISFFAAKSVIDGDMSLGMLVGAQYIIGQMNGPLDQFTSIMNRWQDAKISLERFEEIHQYDNEKTGQVNQIPENASLHISNLSFKYPGPEAPFVIKDMNYTIQHNKTTAIVGHSGSGKTTLLKLLLGFYLPQNGNIMLDSINLSQFELDLWRSKCGVVMQDGFIFSDTIAGNIAVGDNTVDFRKLHHACDFTNLSEFISSLPLGYNTMIGEKGTGLSQGQKQRLLMARAIYKNPDYIFLDEATNALDANNELVILNNLSSFLKKKTAVIVAHRLSTVKNADEIIVLDKGKIVEKGTHNELVKLKGAYFNLINNQLELGS